MASEADKTAKTLRLDETAIKNLRKDFLALARNIPRVEDDKDLEKLRNAFRVFRTRFNRIFFEEWLNDSFKYEDINHKDYYERELRSTGWNFYLELSFPGRFWDERKKWENRLKAKARPLWKTLFDFVRDQEGQSHDIKVTDVHQMTLEGFKVRLIGDPHQDMTSADRFSRFKEALKIFRKRAAVFPPLLRMMLPLNLVVNGGLDVGGLYKKRFIEINLMGFTDKNPARFAQVIAHEMGHHIFRVYLSQADRAFWDETVRGNYTTMTPAEIEKALSLWPDGAWLYQMPDKLKDVDPKLAIQLSLIGWGHGGKSEFQTKEEFQAVVDRGESIPVPKNPITGYAGKNSEEAFCEAFGMLVGFGPRTVDPLVRSWLRMILPNLKTGKNNSRLAVIRKCLKEDKDDRPADEQEWCLYTKDGDQLLGRHPSKEDALKQEAVIEMHKSALRVASRFLDKIPGGLGDKKTPSDFDQDQLSKGIEVELEHTKDRSLAREIAMDHLTEDPEYYDKLQTVEKHAAARYKEKKKVKSEDGGETTVYVYSERQIADRNRKKAERVAQLGKSIQKLRGQVKKDLKSSDPATKLTALAVALMDHTYERVGNPQSAKEGHFGVTGWQKKHVSFGSGGAKIKYVGKSGVEHEKIVTDAAIKKVLKDSYSSLGKDSDCILSWDGGCVTAEDVNAYLKPFGATAKDIRGYHANDEMRSRLKKVRSGKLPEDKKEREKTLKDEFKKALEETAQAVGHEASTLKSQYLIPGLEDAYLKDGKVITAAQRVVQRFASRPIPLDKTVVMAQAKELAQGLKVALKRRYPQDEPLGSLNLPKYVFRTELSMLGDWVNVKGDPIGLITLVVVSEPSPSAEFVLDGALGKVSGKPLILVTLNGKYTTETLGGVSLDKNLYTLLIHELTHALDYNRNRKTQSKKIPVPAAVDLDAYYNDPAEVKAYMQEAVDYALEAAPKLSRVFKGPKLVKVVLQNNRLLGDIEPYLTTSNRNKIFKAVYTALEEADFLS